MDESVRQFIETARKAVLHADMEQKELAAELRVTPQHLNAVLNGRANLSRKLEQGLCSRLGLSPAALWSSSEGLVDAMETNAGCASMNTAPAYAPIPLRGGLLSHVAMRRDWLACRSAGFAEPEHGTEQERSKVFLVRMEGDAMWPDIADGALVLVDGAQCELAHGRVFYMRLHGTLCFRRLDVEQGRVLAVSTATREAVVDSADDPLEILGRALWCCADL